MNHITRLLTKIVMAVLSTQLFTGCVKYETRDFDIEKPQSLYDQEALDELASLRSASSDGNSADITLSAELPLATISANHPLYRLMKDHMNEVSITTSLYPMNVLNNEGNADVSTLSQALAVNSEAENPLSVHFGHLLWHEQQFSAYLNNLIADVYIPGETGIEVVHDFEIDNLGDIYPVLGSGSNVVVNDPDRESGKALNIKGAQTFPQIRINLPEGRTLADYKTVIMDFKGGGCCGYYGGGMRLGISSDVGNVNLGQYGSPASFGITMDRWGRGLIMLSIANLNLTAAQKEWTSFVLTIGSATGSADYLMDNIKMEWEIPGQTIVKTVEERKVIFTTELEKWVAAVGESGKDKITSWSVAYQPIDDTDPTKLRTGVGKTLAANTFYWQDYLGRDYAAIAIKQLHKYANAQDKIFLTETNLLNNSAKLQGLMDLINYTDEQGVKVHGIVSELDINLTTDRNSVENLLKDLAATEKLIKVAIKITTGSSVQQTTRSQYVEQENMYKWFVQSYIEHIPKERRAGIIFSSPTDAANQNAAAGVWTNNAGYQRKPSYRGVLEALQGK